MGKRREGAEAEEEEEEEETQTLMIGEEYEAGDSGCYDAQ